VTALQAYGAGTMREQTKQYTIRRVPGRVDKLLRERATRYGVSLNQAALTALAQGLGIEEGAVVHHDLDDLAGSWVQDGEFDRAMAEMHRIDPALWQ